MSDLLLEVKDLIIRFHVDRSVVYAVNDLNFTLKKGSVLGIVGESGSGKSVTALSIIGLIKCPPGKIERGEIIFQGEDLLKKSPSEMRKIRGNRISMVFQDPMTSLNPLLTIGDQLTEAVLLHQKVSRTQAVEKAIDMMKLVRIPSPEKRIRDYPHNFSGGMRQRVMIAMALSCNPSLLIADEPTTALDVTVQSQILDLMKKLNKDTGAAIILITHDLGIVSELCENVLVMYGGNCVEYSDVRSVFKNPLHPYTLGLLSSLPRIVGGEKKRLVSIKGQPPVLTALPEGCVFYPRCNYREDKCKDSQVLLHQSEPGHMVRCVRAGEISFSEVKS